MEVTIIVTTYHRPDFLFRCLLAIKLQTFKDFECIVVSDNCSYAEAVFKEFEHDTRFILYKRTGKRIDNVGAVGKNIGIKLSGAKLICYCDDDNILLSDHVARLHGAIKAYKKQLVFGHFHHVEHKSAYDILYKPLYYTGKSEVRNRDAMCMMHDKAIAYAAGMWQPMESVGYNEDGHFIAKLYEAVENDFKFIDDVTCIYNAHPPLLGYEEMVLNMHGTYVYPELIGKLKMEYNL